MILNSTRVLLRRYLVAPISAAVLLTAACGTDTTNDATAATDRPTIVVSTNIMGDVVENLVGDAATVITIMPVGADPHDFQPSAQQIAELTEADAVVVSGGGFEEGLLDVIESAEADGVLVFEAITAVDTLEYAEGSSHDDDHGDDEHEDEDHDDEHSDDEHEDEDHKDEHSEHEHSDGVDPHFFSDPVQMSAAAAAITEFLISDVEGIDAEAVRAASDSYLAELAELDAAIEETLASIEPADRLLVTNHQVLTYFADRYDFEVIGTVIPGGSTVDSASAEVLADLAKIIEEDNIPAVFTDTSSSDELAQTLALEAGEVDVVELFSESLGPEDSDGSTYLDMMQANADRITAALSR